MSEFQDSQGYIENQNKGEGRALIHNFSIGTFKLHLIFTEERQSQTNFKEEKVSLLFFPFARTMYLLVFHYYTKISEEIN